MIDENEVASDTELDKIVRLKKYGTGEIMSDYSIWELFLEELKRNIEPKRKEIENQFRFLEKAGLCDRRLYDNLVQVRYMAAYEQVINEYLHPPIEWKQGNIKSEILHLGTIYEGILSIFIKALVREGIITEEAVKRYNKKFKKCRGNLTFNQLINVAKDYGKTNKTFMDLLKIVDEMRKERNKVHLDAISPNDYGEVAFEEFRAVKMRRKLDTFLQLIEHMLIKENIVMKA